jgi:two-component system LytT family response regulator
LEPAVIRPIRTLIVDDEGPARSRIRRLVISDADFDVIGECATGEEAIEFLKTDLPDLLFVDIQMPGADGFAVVRSVDPQRLPVVVFVTAFDAYALRAFEALAFDYVLKPFDRKRFLEVLARVKSQVELKRRGRVDTRLLSLLEGIEKRAEWDRIAIRSGGSVVVVRVETIDWVEAADNYVCLHCGKQTHVVRETMNSFEQRLDPSRFARIHRSTIVNLDRVKQIQPWLRGDYQVVLEDGTRLSLSRSQRDKVRSLLLRQ